MSLCLDIAPVQNCKNPDSYGMICVKCNKCGRFTVEYKCANCGRLKKSSFGLPEYWAEVEFYDKFRAPLCPDCKPFFTKKELVADGYSHSTISCNQVDFVKRQALAPAGKDEIK